MAGETDSSPAGLPPGVAERLEALGKLYVPERLEDARKQAAQAPVRPPESFDKAVARRLEELRALSELTNYLHQSNLARRGER